MNLFLRKSIDELRADAFSEGEHSLKRALSATNLVLLGIGAIIGTGIFVLIGNAAAQYAGPSIVLSIVVAGVGCAFAGLCYAEFAAMIPIAGSAYTYGYATLGELIAWIIGWDLILEYLFGAATVAVGWSGWTASLLRDFGVRLPPALTHAPGTELVQAPGSPAWVQVTPQLGRQLAERGVDVASLPHATGGFDVPASLAILAVTALLVIGIRESARFNDVVVVVKLAVVAAFIGAGAYFLVKHPGWGARNWTPFVPPNQGDFGAYGWSGVLRAAGVIFFAYIGFDAVSTTAQEARDPQRDMPVGILGSLLVCTVLYLLVSGILTAVAPFSQLDVAEPIAVGVEIMGYHFLATVVKVGVIAGLSSVMLVMLMSQPRIFYSMARDGLLPSVFQRLHPRFRTPYVSTLLTGGVCSLVAGLVPLTLLGQLVSIGTLLAFVIVCGGVWWLRVHEPARERPFRTPWVPAVPALGIVVCLAMMAGLPLDTWIRLVVWLVIGLAVYFGYGRHHSVLRAAGEGRSPVASGQVPVEAVGHRSAVIGHRSSVDG